VTTVGEGSSTEYLKGGFSVWRFCGREKAKGAGHDELYGRGFAQAKDERAL